MSKQINLWWNKTKRAQSNTDNETWKEGGVVPTINSFDVGDKRTTTIIKEIKGFDEYNFTLSDAHHTLKCGKDKTGIINAKKVRRLTPLECERLQGFPDNWTDIMADTNRYKQMGNAVAVPVVDWLIKGFN